MPAPPPRATAAAAAPLAPTPKHLLRSHGAPVNALWLSDDNERVYSGDAAGTVAVASTRTLRALAVWEAHADGVLGVQEWGGRVLTHGRDNKLHIWAGVHFGGGASPRRGGNASSDSKAGEEEPARTLGGGSAALPGLATPVLLDTLDVNALNFCRFSLLALPPAMATDDREALLAVPNLVESAYADVWTLPGKQRLHAAIGKAGAPDGGATDGREGSNPVGIIMSMHLSSAPHPHAAGRSRLRLLCAYENGSVTMREHGQDDRETSVEGAGWDVLWTVKLHVESVMGMTVSRDGALALTVSADHLIGRYNLAEAERPDTRAAACQIHRTKHPGNASVALRDDGRVCAVGGWDGRVRLYSTKSFKHLGTLTYHKKNCQAVVFARSQPDSAQGVGPSGVEDDEDDMSEAEKAERSKWLVSGAHDNRIAIWSLIDFGRT